MGLFQLMFFRVGKEFRSLVKMVPALQILYPRQCSEKTIPFVEAKWGWRFRESTKELQVWWTTFRFWECKHTETMKGGQSDRPGCSSTSFFHPHVFSGKELPCTLSSSATPWISPSATCKVIFVQNKYINIYKHISSYPKGVFCWAFLNTKINYIIRSVPNFMP